MVVEEKKNKKKNNVVIVIKAENFKLLFSFSTFSSHVIRDIVCSWKRVKKGVDCLVRCCKKSPEDCDMAITVA